MRWSPVVCVVGLVLSATLAAWTASAAEPTPDADGFVALFDGKSLDGWDGSRDWFRVEEGAIVGGSLEKKVPRNEFLTTKESYRDFELRLKFKLVGEGVNAGVQIRSQRIPNHHEMIGYQADLGQHYTGALYDESRRNKILASPKPEDLAKAFKPGEWNDYRILCEAKRIRLWINEVATVDYTEADPAIDQKGLIGLQIHGGPPSEVWYKDVRIKAASNPQP